MADVADEIPGWHELSDSGRDTLRDLAELFLDDGTYDVEVSISQGGRRTMHVRTTPSTLKRIRNGNS